MDTRSDQQFSQTENIFRTLIEESLTPVGLYVGPDMIIKVANKTIINIFGKGDDVLNKPYFDVLPELREQSIFNILNDVYATGIAYEATEDRVDLVVGGQLQKFYFNFSFKPLKDAEGKVWGVLNTAADVTELVLTRQQLAESEQLTQFALSAAELGTWNFNPADKTIVWDSRCQELFGFKKGDHVKYEDALNCIHPDDINYANSKVLEAVDDKIRKPFDIQYRTVDAENRIRWVRAMGRAYFTEDGICNRFAGTVQDITREILDTQEQQKLLSLVDNSSDFISLSNLEGVVTYLNKAGRKMVGIEKYEDAFRPGVEYVMPGEVDRAQQVYETAAQKGQWTGEINYRHFVTGEPIPVSATTMLIYDPLTGKSLGRASVSRDMRREIADKKALIASEHLLQNITAAAPIALWMSDKDGNITYANKTWTDWTGYTFEETMGQGWLQAILPDDRQRAADKFLADLTARKPYEVNFRLISKSRVIRWCIATGNPQYYSDGSFSGYIGACTDVTEKTLAEQQLNLKNDELADQINQFEFVTGFMPVQLWTAKTDGELDYVNRRTIDFFGVERDKIIGPQWLSHVHPDDRDGAIAAWTRALQSGEVYQFEFRLQDKEGVYKWHLARAFPFISDGKIIKWFGTNTDIDEQKQLQRQKDDFLGIASHELKTPVTSIKAYTQVLGAMFIKEGEKKKAEMVLRMDAQINRLTNLIGDLLDVTKINAGKLQFNKTWFDVNKVVAETVEDMQHTTQKHKLITKLNDTGQIFSDKDRISQVITNLITNAIKYSPHSEEVIIHTKTHNNEVIVSVKDFGIGIPDDKKDRVFEQFYRVSGDKQHTFPGLGLGLYISSEIIKREGGKMWVNSTEGKGSDFCFSLPIINNAEI